MVALLNSTFASSIGEFLPRRQWQSRFFSFPSSKFITHSYSINSIQIQPSISDSAIIPLERRYPKFPTVMDVNHISEILPHRFPLLLVDRVIEYIPKVSIVGIKNVTQNDYFLVGNFDGKPVMPGVLILEAMAQVGGIVLLSEFGGDAALGNIEKVVFRKPVIPGDTLVMKMEVIKIMHRARMGKIEGKAYVGGELVAQASFLLATNFLV